MPRVTTSCPEVVTDLPYFREVVGGVNALLDAMVVAAVPVLTHALADSAAPVRAAPRSHEPTSDDGCGL
jgi:hypothetical protein